MAVLETPWFMKTKTSDLGRINKVFDERFQASIALIQLKQRKSIMKMNDEIKTIKSDFKHIRSEVDFSKDLDEYGKPIGEKTIKAKESGQDGCRSRGGKYHPGGGTGRNIPPELEIERQRYMRLRQRDRRRGMTMLELKDMCHQCVLGENTDEASNYMLRAKAVLFPKPKRPKRLKSVEHEDGDNLDKFHEETDTVGSRPLRVPRIDIDTGKNTPESVAITTDRKSIRPSSASSIASTSLKPTLSRYRSMDIVGSSDIPGSLGLMTSVSI